MHAQLMKPLHCHGYLRKIYKAGWLKLLMEKPSRALHECSKERCFSETLT